MSVVDAERLDVREGDVVRVESPRGAIEVQARVGPVREGAVFAPFHYGSWDLPDPDPAAGAGRTANELTLTKWDPVSKQPQFKTCACRVTLVRRGDGPAPAPTTAASTPASENVAPTAGGAATSSWVLDVTPVYPNDPSCGTSTGAPTETIAGRSVEGRSS
jgi:predicted molibdopterin-dependent oxidoreductase YjgC